jgi:kynurenine formamidase
MTATARPDLLAPKFVYQDPEVSGVTWLHFDLDGDTYEDVKKLPAIIEYRGQVFVRTGWHSDRREAYYKSSIETVTSKVLAALRNVKGMMYTPVGQRKYKSQFEQDVLQSVLDALIEVNEVSR